MFKQPKKILLTLLFVATLAAVFAIVIPEPGSFAHAAPAAAPPTAESVTESLGQGISKTLASVQRILMIVLVLLNYITWPLLMMIGALMDSDLIVGPGMEDSLLQIWRDVRNIVNIFFALALLVMAIYNVLGFGEEGPLSSYAFKKMLPRFVLAVILVNFSFIICKVILDVADTLTNAVFAVPQYGVTQLNEAELAKKICPSFFSEKLEKIGVIVGTEGENQLCDNKTTFTGSAIKFFKQDVNSNTAALMLAINMGQLHSQMDISEVIEKFGEAGGKITLDDFLINTLFSVLIFVVYAITFGVLALFLIVRVVVLWLVIALSPLAALMLVLPEEANASSDFDIKKQFLTHAFAPVVIAFSMAIGFMMLTAYQKLGGSFSPGSPESLQLGVTISGMGDVHKLILATGAVVVVWVGVFTAAGKSEVIGTMIGNFKNTMETWGKEIATSWKYATIIPIKVDGQKTGYSLEHFIQKLGPGSQATATRFAVEAAEDPNKDFMRDYLLKKGPSSAGVQVLPPNETINSISAIQSQQQLLSALPSIYTHANDQRVREAFNKMLQRDSNRYGQLLMNDPRILQKGRFADQIKNGTFQQESEIKGLLENYDPAKAQAAAAQTAPAAQPAQKPAATQQPFNDQRAILDAIEDRKSPPDVLVAQLLATQNKGLGDAKIMANELMTVLGGLTLKELIKEDHNAVSSLFNTFSQASDRQVVMSGLKGKSGSDASDILDAVVAAKTQGKAAGVNMISGADQKVKTTAENIINTLKIK